MRALLSGQISDLLRKIPNTKYIFKGITTRDLEFRPPKKIQKTPQAFIHNVGYAKKGTHWVVILFTANGSFLFDSYGRTAKELLIESSVVQPYHTITYNPFNLQARKSLVCGHYCIFFLYLISKQKTVEQINRYFSGDRIKNDNIVFRFVVKLGKKWGVQIL